MIRTILCNGTLPLKTVWLDRIASYCIFAWSNETLMPHCQTYTSSHCQPMVLCLTNADQKPNRSPCQINCEVLYWSDQHPVSSTKEFWECFRCNDGRHGRRRWCRDWVNFSFSFFSFLFQPWPLLRSTRWHRVRWRLSRPGWPLWEKEWQTSRPPRGRWSGHRWEVFVVLIIDNLFHGSLWKPLVKSIFHLPSNLI